MKDKFKIYKEIFNDIDSRLIDVIFCSISLIFRKIFSNVKCRLTII